MQQMNKLALRRPLLAFLVVILVGLFGYTNSEAKGGHGAHWGYEGDGGPEHWGELNKDYAACSKGESQSPIDITGAAKGKLSKIKFNYKPTKLNILNNGHTVQVNYDKGSSIEVGGEKYRLLQFHFHTPSEHTVDGRSFGMEMHLVHKSNKGELAVVGVLLDKGAENKAFKIIWENLPEKANQKKSVKVSVNAADLMPSSKVYYAYSGSLTTPPCSEGVKWHVLRTPLEMSEEQIDIIHSIIHDNNRPVQSLNDRKLVR
jgi:carbonic anhydrase